MAFYKAAAGIGATALVAIASFIGWQTWQGRDVVEPVPFKTHNGQ